MKLDATLPLKPGMLVREKKKIFGQQFVYKNLLGICFNYGRVGHGNEDYREVEDGGLRGQAGRKRCEELRDDGLVLVGVEKVGMEVEGTGRPKLGPWLLTTRVRQ